MSIEVLGLGSALPKRVMTNDEWASRLDTNDEWIVSHTGIHSRHIADSEETTATMAIEAAAGALKKAGLSAGDLDMIIVATCSPDYLGFPAVANLVQKALGATRAGAFDLHAACTGFIYALAVGSAFLKDGHGVKHALIIGAETISRIMDWEDRSTAILFGDGAGAAVIKLAADADKLFDYSLHSDGDASALSRPKGGVKEPLFNDVKETYLTMNGASVYAFAVRALGLVIDELLDRHGLSFDQIDMVVPHQANRRIIEALCNRKHWPIEKFFLNLDHTANTSAASIPLALAEMDEKKLLKRGQKILMAGFGAGLTWGGALLEW